MPHFKPGDAVLLLGKYIKLYPGIRGVVLDVKQDPSRPIFNEYTIEFAGGSKGSVLQFQLVEDASLWPTVAARVVTDSVRGPVVNNVRGTIHTREIVMQAGQLDLHIELIEAGQRRALLGQVLEKNTNRFADAEIRLIENFIPIQVATANLLGEFEFPSVLEGSMTLEVLLRASHTRILAEIQIDKF